MNIPILDLQAQYKSIKKDIDAAIKRVIDSQHFILGPEVEAFESEVAMYCGTKYAIGVASGTDALILSLKALGIGPGDEVITTPFTFFATAESVSLVGAKPVFVDIDPKTYCINPELIEDKIAKDLTKIIHKERKNGSAFGDFLESFYTGRENDIHILHLFAESLSDFTDYAGLMKSIGILNLYDLNSPIPLDFNFDIKNNKNYTILIEEPDIGIEKNDYEEKSDEYTPNPEKGLEILQSLGIQEVFQE